MTQRLQKLIFMARRVCADYNITLPRIIQDNRIRPTAGANYYRNRIRINMKATAHWDIIDLYHTLFHELGHLAEGGAPYKTDEEIQNSEHFAEKFAIECTKKYFPHIDIFKLRHFHPGRILYLAEHFENHFRAYVKIPEYREVCKSILLKRLQKRKNT